MASIEYIVNAVDSASGTFSKIGLSVDRLDRQLADLSKRVATPAVDLNDKAYALKMAGAAVKLDRLSKMVARPEIDLQGLRRAELGILRLDAMLDALDRKHATATVGVDRSLLSRVGGLLGRGGGWQALWGLAGAGGNAALPGAGLLGGIAAALPLLPAAIPFLLGGGVGLGGGLLAARLGATGANTLQTDRQAVARARAALRGSGGNTASNRVALRQALGQLAQDQAAFGPFAATGFGQTAVSFRNLATRTLAGALTSTAGGFSGGPGGHPDASFLQGLTGILKQVGGFVKSLGPGLGALFRASLPFVSAFVKIMEQFAKAVLPAITQSLKQMAPSLPIMVQGFKYLSLGIAGFIKQLGPGGMKDSAIIFKAAMKIVMGVLQLAGWAVNLFTEGIVKGAEAVRWFARNVPPWFDKMRHGIASIFDGIRHDVAQIWDGLWQVTIGQVERGIQTVESWFRKLPAGVQTALRGLGALLQTIGKTALSLLLKGLQAGANPIVSWIRGFASGIVGIFKKIWGWFSPSAVMYQGGKSLMEGLAKGIKDHAHLAQAAAAKAAGGFGGHGVTPSGPVQAYARNLVTAVWGASQWPAFADIVMRESGWRVNATNPTSGAYGIPQALPPGKMASAGADWRTNPFTQIRWMVGYIRSRWGTPARADLNERTQHWYGTGLQGGIFTRPTIIGVGERGPERVDVTPVGQGGGDLGPKLDRQNKLLAQLLAAMQAAPDRTGAAVGGVINGAARGALYGGRYSSR